MSNKKTRQEKIRFIRDYQKGKALPPIMGIVFIDGDEETGSVFMYQSINGVERFEEGQQPTLEEFRKSGKMITSQVHLVDFSKG